MITDKDREEAVSVISAYLGGGTEAVEKELSIYRTESLEQSSKEYQDKLDIAVKAINDAIAHLAESNETDGVAEMVLRGALKEIQP